MSVVPDRRVVIVPSRPEWAEEFRAIARVLRAALGRLALRIDQHRSTAVPGLAAKDVIDVQVSVADLDPALVPRMEGASERGVYAETKDPACDLIMVAAEAWAAETGWSP